MAALNLYRSETSYTVVLITDLGDISDWEDSRVGLNDNNIGGIIGGISVAKWKRHGSLGADNPLNRIDFGGASSIRLYANSTLNMSIYMDTLWSTGYKQVLCTGSNMSNVYMRFEVSNDGNTGVLNRIYLARATINGTTYLGFYVYNERESSGQLGQVGFYANSSWSEAFLEEAYFLNTDNPYWGGGYSEPGGGDSNKQSWSESSDFVGPDALPDEAQVGAVGCGLITIFTPSQSQLTRLAEMLWNKTFYDYLVNQINGIEDLFVSLGVVPFNVTAGDPVAISFMNFWEYVTPSPVSIPTSVSLTKAAKQWEEFNMGNVSLVGGDTTNGHTSDSVLDYSPYSKLGIYLPFIGYQELDIDECRGNTINLKYRVDILSGACLALISINGRTIYQFTGNCMTQLPLTSADYSQIVQSATNVAIAASSAGTAAAVASAGDALTASRVSSGKIDAAMGNYQNAQHAAQVSNAENSLAGATANGMAGMKPTFKKSGAISGSTSIFGVMQPYLHLTTPRQSMPDGYEKVCGFPCNVGGKLGDFSGYTVVEDVRLNGLVATSPEVDEIYKLLKNGIII